MSRKKNKRRQRNQPPLQPAQFAVGTQVRVKAGIKDPDYPDMPLGGWTGTIVDVEEGRPNTYLVEWDERTLKAMHPVYRSRCERDGLDLASYWLHECDLEPSTGAVVPIEQPTEIVSRPLRMSDPEDRVRSVLGATSDDPLPPVTAETLRRYHVHLIQKLKFPFNAHLEEEIGPFQLQLYPVSVTGLLDPEEGDVEEGLICAAVDADERIKVPLAELVVGPSNRHSRTLEDYQFWFWNADHEGEGSGGGFPFQEAMGGPFPPQDAPAELRMVVPALLIFLLGGALYGGTVGAALMALEGADVAVRTGAMVLGIVGFLLGMLFSLLIARWAGGIVGAMLGAVLGSVLGLFALIPGVTFLGAVGGGLLGRFVGDWLPRWPTTFFGLVLGTLAGILGQAWSENSDKAWLGGWYGSGIGALAGPCLFLLASVLTMIPRRLPPR